MEFVELFDGAIRVNPWLLALDMVLLGHFIASYISNCLAKGYRIDFWHFTLLMNFVVPTLIVFPFNASITNVRAVGSALWEIERRVNDAFLISIVGYICAYTSYYLFPLTVSSGLSYKLVDRVSRVTSTLVQRSIHSNASMFFYIVFGVVVALLVTLILISRNGVEVLSTGLRDYALTDPSLRPIINFAILTYAPIILVFFSVRFVQTRERWVGVGFLIALAISLLSGTRSGILFPLLNVAVTWLIVQRRRVSLVLTAIVGLVVLILFFLIADIRSGVQPTIESLLDSLAFKMFYGGNFGDNRDFAWVLSAWDGRLSLGGTYLAALLSFIPRSLSTFREQNSIAFYTIDIVGLPPELHAGLRIGFFGEPYLNFGIIGVILLGFFSGYILRFIDFSMKKNLCQFDSPKRWKIVETYSNTVLFAFIFTLHNTNGFPANYMMLFVLLVGVLIQGVIRGTCKRKTHLNLRTEIKKAEVI